MVWKGCHNGKIDFFETWRTALAQAGTDNHAGGTAQAQSSPKFFMHSSILLAGYVSLETQEKRGGIFYGRVTWIKKYNGGSGI